MTQHGDPYENAVAERVNGILKDGCSLDETLPSFARADALVGRAGRTYYELRPPGSCDFLTPSQAHEQEEPLVRRWKNYYQPATIPASTCPPLTR